MLEQVLEGGVGNPVHQGVLQCPGREPDPLVHQQADLAEDLALAETVVQLAGAAEDLHRAAADVIEPAAVLAEVENGASGPEILHLDALHHLLQQCLRHLVEGRVLGHVIPDIDEFRLHARP